MKSTGFIIINRLNLFWRDQDGATAIEYSLIVSLIGLMLMTGAAALGTDLNGVFQTLGLVFASPPDTAAPVLAGP